MTNITQGKYKMACSLCKHSKVADVKKYNKYGKKYEELSEFNKENVLNDIRWGKGFFMCECDKITCNKCTIQVEHSIGGINGMYMCKNCADDTCKSIEGEKYCKVCNCFITDGQCKCK